MKKGLEIIQCPLCRCRSKLIYDFSISTICIYCDVEGVTYKLVETDHVLLENIILNLKKVGQSQNLWFVHKFERQPETDIIEEFENQLKFLDSFPSYDKIEIRLSIK